MAKLTHPQHWRKVALFHINNLGYFGGDPGVEHFAIFDNGYRWIVKMRNEEEEARYNVDWIDSITWA